MAISTGHQRLYASTLMRDLDMPSTWITTAHAPALKAAGLQARGGEDMGER